MKPNKPFIPRIVKDGQTADATEISFLVKDQGAELRTKYLNQVRGAARKLDIDVFEDELGYFFETWGSIYPMSIIQSLKYLENQIEYAYTELQDRTTDYIANCTYTYDPSFLNLSKEEVQEFFKGFDKTLRDFYIYSELLATNVGQMSSNTKVDKDLRGFKSFEELDFSTEGARPHIRDANKSNFLPSAIDSITQSDIVSELFADSLMIFTKYKAAYERCDHSPFADYPVVFEDDKIAEELPTLYYDPQSVGAVFYLKGRIDAGLTKGPDYEVTFNYLLNTLLDDPLALEDLCRELDTTNSVVQGSFDSSHRRRGQNRPKPEPKTGFTLYTNENPEVTTEVVKRDFSIVRDMTRYH